MSIQTCLRLPPKNQSLSPSGITWPYLISPPPLPRSGEEFSVSSRSPKDSGFLFQAPFRSFFLSAGTSTKCTSMRSLQGLHRLIVLRRTRKYVFKKNLSFKRVSSYEILFQISGANLKLLCFSFTLVLPHSCPSLLTHPLSPQYTLLPVCILL